MTTIEPKSAIAPPTAAIEALASSLDGALIQPGDAAYDDARKVWNGMIDRKPGFIVRCASDDDVARGIRFAAAHGLPLTTRAGGHNVAGSALNDGGVVIDLTQMNRVEVDPETRTVRAQGGALIADVDAATEPHGLAVPLGVVSETGIAGLTLGGGLGWLRRKYGLSCDNLIAADVVTATGEKITASETQHPDLFWALRGGSGSFGVVTTFTFRAHPVGPELWFTVVFYPIEKAHEGLRLYRDFASGAPDELSAFAILCEAPAVPEIPEEWHHQDSLIFVAAWSGDLAEGERVTAPLRNLGDPIADLSGPAPYSEIQVFFDEDYPKYDRYYWKSNYMDELTDEAIDELITRAVGRPSGRSSVDIWQLGGRVGQVRPGVTAYPHRSAPYLLGFEANWSDEADDAANIAWARDLYAATRRFSAEGGVYVNFPGFGEEAEELVKAAYGSSYQRLQEIAVRYDPEGVFRFNRHIHPAN